MMQRAEQMGAGAVIAKGFSDLPVMRHSPSPRYAVLHRQVGEIGSDTFYSYEQASEHDAEAYAEMLAEAKRRVSIPVIANVDCQDVDSFVQASRIIAQSGCDALELNVSCPHGSIAFSGRQVEERIVEVAREVRKVVAQPLIVKLTPQLTSPASLVAALAETGVQAVTLFNRFLGLELGIEDRRPILHGSFGGHGGLWMFNFVLRWVATIAPQSAVAPDAPQSAVALHAPQSAVAPDAPRSAVEISASGGVADGRDVAALILAGAQTVQVCSALYLRGWEVLRRINAQLREELERLGLASVEELRGGLHGRILGLDDVDRRRRFAARVNTRGVAPCRAECPVGEDVQGCVNLVAEGKYEQALALTVANHPFPHVLGRCCHHPCEAACARAEVDDPISIRELKRIAADQGERYGPVRAPRAAPREARVAVIGAGPAGLTAAYRFGLMGYPVTVFERLPKPGGMLVAGIPSYRLPRDVLEADLQRVWDAGVQLRTGVGLGRDLTLGHLREQGFAATVIACGAHTHRPLGVPGEDRDGVLEGIVFLRRHNLGLDVPRLGRSVAVVGGGDVAVDAARVARRLGAEVRLLYRRRVQDMPAREEDLADALEEGVQLVEQVQPLRIEPADGGRLRVVCAHTVAGEVGADGRAGFTVLAEDTTAFEADTVIVAVGQELDSSWLEEAGAAELLDGGRVVADPVTGATRLAGVFACGDAVTGPRSLVEAVAAGKRVALAVDAWLRGEEPTAALYDLDLPVVSAREAVEAAGGDDLLLTRRQQPVSLPAEERLRGPVEVNRGLRPHHAEPEAARCLACGGCGACGDCLRICPYLAIERGRVVEVDREECDGCGLCALLCRQGAVEMVERDE